MGVAAQLCWPLLLQELSAYQIAGADRVDRELHDAGVCVLIVPAFMAAWRLSSKPLGVLGLSAYPVFRRRRYHEQIECSRSLGQDTQ
jgi:hypothetical protein